MQTALKRGDNIQLIAVPYAAHHEYNVPNSVVWSTILRSCNRLLN